MEKNTKTTKNNSCGALWVKKSKQGNTFLAGQLTTADGEPIKIVVFKNTYKQEGSTQPDYRIYLEESNDKSAAPKAPTAKAAKQESAPMVESTEDDIPF